MNILLNISTGDWINIIIASITLITAIIAFLTINEMRKQRVHSYFPDINLANFSFYVYKADDTEEIDSIYLYSYKNQKEENEKIGGFNELKTEINNIGFGVAKNIKWNWTFDIKEAEKVICKDESVKWENGEDFISIDSSKIKVKWAFDLKEDNIGGNFNFLLPYSNENRKNEIVIPDYFINLYWLYMVNQIEPTPKTLYDYFPPLELNLNYTDIHSNELKKTFSIRLNFDMIAGIRDKTKELAKLKFEIEEK